MITKFKIFENNENSVNIFSILRRTPILSILKNYLKNGGDINIKNFVFETLIVMLSELLNDLSLTASYEIRNMINFLIDNDADLNIISKNSDTLFGNLINYTKDLKLIKKTIDNGINVNAISEKNDPLHICIINVDVIEKDFEKAKLIIESSNFNLFYNNWSYLYTALNYERYDIMKILFENGAEIDDKLIRLMEENYHHDIKEIKNRFPIEYQKYIKKKEIKRFKI